MKYLSKKMFIVRRLRSTIKFSKIFKDSPKILIIHIKSNSLFPSISAAVYKLVGLFLLNEIVQANIGLKKNMGLY